MKSYIVAEGEFDAELLTKLVESEIPEPVLVSPAGGKSSAISFAKSILASRLEPVALVTDAETIESASVREQERVLYDLIRTAAQSTPFRVFLAVPELEIVFFQDPQVLAVLVGCEVTAQDVQEAQYRPRAVLDRLCQRGRTGKGREELLTRLTPDLSRRLAKHALVQSLIQFIRRPVVWEPWKNSGKVRS
ncbi:MAG TPA: hypothetical protein VF615_12060 [Longimicrobiaceae bacterium]|jgi:hypothetical protein